MINWKIRFKNPTFWVQLVISILLAVMAYLGLSINDLTSWNVVKDALIRAVSTPYVFILAGTIVYNALIDPTTTGISDSANAMKYDKPNSNK